jgi:glycosyltransferase involved in cell wall biosynthesis
MRTTEGCAGPLPQPGTESAATSAPKAMLYNAPLVFKGIALEALALNRPEGVDSEVRADSTAGVPQLSIVIPAYNERDNLLPLWEELRTTLASLDRTFEVIFVDDGSDDGSREVLAAVRRASSEVRVLRLAANSGQTAAMMAGFRAARGAIVVTLDADRQNDPADIAALLACIPGHDAAVGYRQRRRDSWVRLVSSRVANAVRNALSGDDVIDTGCSLKAFRRECLVNLPMFAGMHRFLPTLIRMDGFRVCQVPVGHRPRVAGRSKYGIGNRVFRSFHDLMAVRWMKSRRLHYVVTEEA